MLRTRVVSPLACLGLSLAASIAVAEPSLPTPTIAIVGSTTVAPFSGVVARHFGAAGAFATPRVSTSSTGDGIQRFCSGEGGVAPDIVNASRPMTSAERTLCAQHGIRKPVELRIGYDSLVIAVPAATAVFGITREQLWRAIAAFVPSGKGFVTNPSRRWRDVASNLPDAPIEVYGPGPKHGTRDALVELLLEPLCRATPEAASLAPTDVSRFCGTLRNDGAWKDVEEPELILGKIAAHPAAVGVLTYSYLEQFPTRIHPAPIDGILPTRATILSGQYPVGRPLYMYVNPAHVHTTPGLADFLGEFYSLCAGGASGYLSHEGLVPLPAAELFAERGHVAQLGR